MGSDLSSVIEHTNDLVDVAHKRGIPVFWARVVYGHPNAADAGVWAKKVPLIKEWKPGTRWVEIDERCHIAEEDHILDKRHASAFHETELDSMLTSMDRDTLIVTGCSTSACIRSTVVDASARGYPLSFQRPASAIGPPNSTRLIFGT